METAMEWLPIGFVYGALGALTFWLGPRAFTFLRAVTSGWSKDNVKARLAICKACPRVKKRDYVDPAGGMTSFLYCDECKCGSHHIAELNTKLGFNHLKCPLDKWGPAGAVTVHEGHDMLIARGKKERAEDKRERENITAGRDRNDNGPLDGIKSDPVPLEQNDQPLRNNYRNRTTQAQAQLQPTADVVEEQRNKIQRARERRKWELNKKRDPVRKPAQAAKQAGKQDKIWGDRPAEESATARAEDETNTAPLAGTDHEGQILVDQKESGDGGHSLD